MAAGLLERPTSGAVQLAGIPAAAVATEAALRDFRRRHIGFVFQKPNLIPVLTAAENVALAMVIDGVPAAEAERRAIALLAALEAAHRAGNRPASLSGGEQQRVAVARALANDPVLVLADEPTAALDSRRGRQVMEVLRSIARERHAAVAVVTHDPRSIDGRARRRRGDAGRWRAKTCRFGPMQGECDGPCGGRLLRSDRPTTWGGSIPAAFGLDSDDRAANIARCPVLAILICPMPIPATPRTSRITVRRRSAASPSRPTAPWRPAASPATRWCSPPAASAWTTPAACASAPARSATTAGRNSLIPGPRTTSRRKPRTARSWCWTTTRSLPCGRGRGPSPSRWHAASSRPATPSPSGSATGAAEARACACRPIARRASTTLCWPMSSRPATGRCCRCSRASRSCRARRCVASRSCRHGAHRTSPSRCCSAPTTAGAIRPHCPRASTT
ncbi:MAG: hypothetical protein B7Z52_02130 [Burkholderiales bacterium 12-64-5]|nr:MAG: hypothetical protein B7Z52_02130 [Burkholderiales bacterium 12-64-5]